MKWRSPITNTSVFLAFILIHGCTMNSENLPHASLIKLLPLSDYPNIRVSEDLQSALNFSPPSKTFSSISLKASSPHIPSMRVSVPFKSVDDNIHPLYYRFWFFNQLGHTIGQAPGFTLMQLKPQIQDYLEGSTLDTTATDWRLEIRSAR